MLKNYFVIAWRNLKRNKVFSVINIAGLSAGIAASLLLFIIVSYEMSYEKFHKNYNNIYHVITPIRSADGTSYNPGITYPALPALRTALPDVQFAGFDCIYGSRVASKPAKKGLANIFGKINNSPLPLRRSSFKQLLSRKAEGYGPMKPWQPRTTAKGANSITHHNSVTDK